MPLQCQAVHLFSFIHASALVSMQAPDCTELDGVCLGLQAGHLPLPQGHQGGRGQEVRQGTSRGAW
jgi:hypothetical protein